jgi:hypothetical protein
MAEFRGHVLFAKEIFFFLKKKIMSELQYFLFLVVIKLNPAVFIDYHSTLAMNYVFELL